MIVEHVCSKGVRLRWMGTVKVSRNRWLCLALSMSSHWSDKRTETMGVGKMLKEYMYDTLKPGIKKTRTVLSSTVVNSSILLLRTWSVASANWVVKCSVKCPLDSEDVAQKSSVKYLNYFFIFITYWNDNILIY